MPKIKKPTEISLLRKEVFPDLHFAKDRMRAASLVLKNEGREAAIEYLRVNHEDKPPNFMPPAKTPYVALSRPLEQWPIAQASIAIQKYIFGLTKDEFSATKKLLYGDKSTPNTESRKRWFEVTGVPNFGYMSAQGLNAIFSGALARYEGVVQKVENRNKKRFEKLSEKNQLLIEEGQPVKDYVPDTAYHTPETLQKLAENNHVRVEDLGDMIDRLVHPPGIHRSIYGYQQVPPFAYDPDNPKGIILPKAYAGYTRKPHDIIEAMPNRLNIPEGQAGYIPEHQRDKLKKGGRVKRLRTTRVRVDATETVRAKAEALNAEKARLRGKEAILAVFQIEEDWALIDMRGLLRNVYMRKLIAAGELTPTTLLGYFTETLTLDPRRTEATFCYHLRSEGALHAEYVRHGKNTRELLLDLTKDNEKIALVTIDLGQRNPLAAAIFRVGRDASGDLTENSLEPVSRMLLPQAYLDQIKAYRDAYDSFRQNIWDTALASLTPEQQRQILAYEAYTPDDSKENVLRLLLGGNVMPDDLPWEDMTKNTHYISDRYLADGGDPSKVWFVPGPRKRKKNAPPLKKPPKPRELVKRSDHNISHLSEFRPQLLKETRDAFEKAKIDTERGHVGYQKLSTRKDQLCKEILNWLEAEAVRLTRCKTMVLGLEDLNGPFFNQGKGKVRGWVSFFRQKQENRWIVNGFRKNALARAHDKGKYILELWPSWTSQTCPKCKHVHADNRHGDDFVCLQCGARLHADAEVATWNLAVVAIQGHSLPGPVREKSNDRKKSGSARKSKKANESGKVVGAWAAQATPKRATSKKETGTARNPVYNPLETQASCPAP